VRVLTSLLPRVPKRQCGGENAGQEDPNVLSADVRLYNSVAAIPQQVWDGLFPGAAEDWSYYRAIESCPPRNFRLGFFAVSRGAAVVAAAPMFRTSYGLHTSLQGGLRHAVDRLISRAPQLLQLPVMVLGSPLLDHCDIGFAPALDVGERLTLMRTLLDGLRAQAVKEHVTLLGLKDVSERDGQMFNSVLTGSGFARMANLPMTYIDLPFRDEEAYLTHLPKKTADYLRRKLRTLPRI
jgi:hypothetical protein